MKRVFSILVLLMLSFIVAPSVQAESSSLYFAPSRGTFFAGSTFSVSIYLDTKGNKINVVDVGLKFPSDILQVSAPTGGESFISEWITPPTYSNVGGVISFKGGIPEGIVTSAGLISTITFRAKSPGIAKVEFLESSKVHLADGQGTPIFASIFSGDYEILVPPPEGPRIFSYTHPDSKIWYSDPSVSFFWEKEQRVTDFSLSFSQNPEENPDTISEGDLILKSYEGVSDGTWYFHLRSKKNGIWGKASHFAVKIDTSPPQKFEPEIDAFGGFVYFEAKDLYSGIDYYEISVLNMSETETDNPFFVEASSPFKILSKESGKYSMVVRAHDRAGNWQDAEARFQMISPLISYIEGKGIEIRGILFSWGIIYFILFVSAGTAACLIFYFSRQGVGFEKGIKEIKEALTEIEKIEKKQKEIDELKRRFREETEKLGEKIR